MNACQCSLLLKNIFQKFGAEFELQRKIELRIREEFGSEEESDEEDNWNTNGNYPKRPFVIF